ncbi:uncharacterized protein LOC144509467 [Mustelus asterias]
MALKYGVKLLGLRRGEGAFRTKKRDIEVGALCKYGLRETDSRLSRMNQKGKGRRPKGACVDLYQKTAERALWQTSQRRLSLSSRRSRRGKWKRQSPHGAHSKSPSALRSLALQLQNTQGGAGEEVATGGSSLESPPAGSRAAYRGRESPSQTSKAGGVHRRFGYSSTLQLQPATFPMPEGIFLKDLRVDLYHCADLSGPTTNLNEAATRTNGRVFRDAPKADPVTTVPQRPEEVSSQKAPASANSVPASKSEPIESSLPAPKSFDALGLTPEVTLPSLDQVPSKPQSTNGALSPGPPPLRSQAASEKVSGGRRRRRRRRRQKRTSRRKTSLKGKRCQSPELPPQRAFGLTHFVKIDLSKDSVLMTSVKKEARGSVQGSRAPQQSCSQGPRVSADGGCRPAGALEMRDVRVILEDVSKICESATRAWYVRRRLAARLSTGKGEAGGSLPDSKTEAQQTAGGGALRTLPCAQPCPLASQPARQSERTANGQGAGGRPSPKQVVKRKAPAEGRRTASGLAPAASSGPPPNATQRKSSRRPPSCGQEMRLCGEGVRGLGPSHDGVCAEGVLSHDCFVSSVRDSKRPAAFTPFARSKRLRLVVSHGSIDFDISSSTSEDSV